MKPKKPPTNILVVKSTVSTWSSAITPEHKHSNELTSAKPSASSKTERYYSDVLFMYL